MLAAALAPRRLAPGEGLPPGEGFHAVFVKGACGAWRLASRRWHWRWLRRWHVARSTSVGRVSSVSFCQVCIAQCSCSNRTRSSVTCSRYARCFRARAFLNPCVVDIELRDRFYKVRHHDGELEHGQIARWRTETAKSRRPGLLQQRDAAHKAEELAESGRKLRGAIQHRDYKNLRRLLATFQVNIKVRVQLATSSLSCQMWTSCSVLLDCI